MVDLYGVCKDCGLELATREDARTHMDETLAKASINKSHVISRSEE